MARSLALAWGRLAGLIASALLLGAATSVLMAWSFEGKTSGPVESQWRASTGNKWFASLYRGAASDDCEVVFVCYGSPPSPPQSHEIADPFFDVLPFAAWR